MSGLIRAKRSLRVLVVGAGTVGPLLAVGLKRIGHDPLLFDSAPSFGDVGGAINLAPNGLRYVRDLGLLDEIERAGTPVKSVSFRKLSGHQFTQFSTEPWRTQFGMVPTGIKRTRMHSLFMAAVSREGIPVHNGKKLKSIKHGSSAGDAAVTASFEDGSQYSADLLFGCDGLKSKTRELLHGPETARYTGVSATIGVSSIINPADPTGAETFIYQGAGYQYGQYGIGNNECVWFIGDKQPDEAKVKESWIRGSLDATEISQQFAKLGFDPAVVQTVARSSRVLRYGIYDREPLKSWSKGACTLVGDAAHPMPPHLGQGGTTSLEDAAVLTELLTHIPEDIPRVFKIYEELRIKRTTDIVLNARRMAFLNYISNPILCSIRDSLMAFAFWWFKKPPVDEIFGYDGRKLVRQALKLEEPPK